MHKSRWNFALGMGLILSVVVACNWSASTANISSLKVSKDEDAKTEASNFGPGDKIYAVAAISNNPGKQSVTFRVLYDDVSGKKSGDMVEGAEKTLEVDGSRPAIFWITLPSAGFSNGRYKFDVVMKNEKGEQKDQKSATFNVSGFSSAPPAKDEEG
jgi:hypothetical protein